MKSESNQTNLIYGMHEKCPTDVMSDGWVLYIAEVGDSNDPHQGIDLSNERRARMIRIQWSFGSGGGCYPPPSRQSGFVQRVESLVANTPDCHIWVAGNEPNLSVEGLFTPEYTADMYKSIRVAIQEQIGHESDCVLLPPIGPWNVEIGYGWIEYFARLIDLCMDIDGFAIHTYSRGPDPTSITSEDKMDAPYDHLYNGFRTYRDWLLAIPKRYTDRPVYITEANQNGPWLDENNGWIQAAYAEIDAHNQWVVDTEWPTIHALVLYRWPKYDEYFIEGKHGVIDDMRAAISHGYTVPEKGKPPMAEWKIIYENDMEQGFYDQTDPVTGNPAPELTVPIGTKVHWLQGPGQGYYPRPECDKKQVPQPEVYEGQFSAAAFYISSEGRLGYVTDRIFVSPGEALRASVMFMRVFHGVAGGGARVGIVMGDGPFAVGDQTAWPKNGPDPFAHESIKWGSWRGSYQGEGYVPDREWVKLETPEIQHGIEFVRLVFQLNADTRGEFTGGHWDNLRLEAFTDSDGGETPPTGDCGAKVIAVGMAEAARIKAQAAIDEVEMWDRLVEAL